MTVQCLHLGSVYPLLLLVGVVSPSDLLPSLCCKYSPLFDYDGCVYVSAVYAPDKHSHLVQLPLFSGFASQCICCSNLFIDCSMKAMFALGSCNLSTVV